VVKEQVHLVFINQHYWPDNAATALALTDLAESLAENGYKVSIICSRYLYDFSGSTLPEFEIKNGVHIHRVNQTNYGRHSHKGRLKDYASYFILALLQSFKLKPDCVITLTTPPLLGTIGFLHKLVRQTRFVYWCMDLHPEAEVAANLFSIKSSIYTLFFKLHEKILASADKIIPLSDNMILRLKKYVISINKLSKISIWSDSEEIKPQSFSLIREKLPTWFKNRFIIHYSGNLGLAHNPECLLKVIQRTSLNDEIGFLFTGGGPQMPILKEKTTQLGLKNVFFKPYVDREDLSDSMACGDVNWLTLSSTFEGIAYPSKLIGYMASGKPILFIGDKYADSAKLIQLANGGFSFTENETEQVYQTILKLKSDTNLQHKLGLNARLHFEKHLTKQVLTQQWHKIIQEIVA
jgi:colanic acid biosynthesis glycosyl transferase WcaI